MTPDELTRLEQLVGEAGAYDGSDALDEATTMAVRDGLAHPHLTDDGLSLWNGGDLTLLVRPSARGRGQGRALLADALTRAPQGRLTAWSHGNHPAAAALAASHGWQRVRDLWVMRRPAALPLPPRGRTAGVTVRGYRDDDAAEVVRVNAAAFAHHPEQGAMDLDNLHRRMAEEWFDPAGLLVAESDAGGLLGFHWTKVHPLAEGQDVPLGEVYVVGVDPAAQGRGLGRVLTLAGLHHLHERGVIEVLLYVESDNAPAVATYTGLGFTHADADTHVMYARA
ncbi:MAG: mycothiol synthase [Nocardioides sp.]|uniref:mycothiol synthase n=1 Tax=Nocardioides sp. TaxID=35761 RepID=UPI003F057B02